MFTETAGGRGKADDIGGLLSSAEILKQIVERMRSVLAYHQALVLVFEIYLDFSCVNYDQSELKFTESFLESQFRKKICLLKQQVDEI